MIRSARANWRAAILVCAECEKKLGKKGFGPDGKDRLSKLLRQRAGGGKGRKAMVGILATKCLKICPKRAVTVIDGAHPGDWMIVKAGTPIEEVEMRLILASPSALAANVGILSVAGSRLADQSDHIGDPLGTT